MDGLTREDTKTVLSFALHLARIDNQFDAWEKRALKNIAEAMKLSDTERSELAAEKISLASALQSLSSADAKALLVKTLCFVASSDGEASEKENEFITKVIKASGEQIMILPQIEWENYESEVLNTLTGARS